MNPLRPQGSRVSRATSRSEARCEAPKVPKEPGTSENDELLAGVIAQPDDTELRQVYADWLEEHGELDRATFIRTECALAGVPKYDPRWLVHWVWTKEHPNAAPLPALPPGLAWHPFTFERGFAAHLSVPSIGALLEHAPAVFALAPIRSLDIDARGENFPLDRLLASPWLANIRSLRFVLGRFGRDQIQRIVECEWLGRIEKLAFAFAGLTVEGLQPLLGPSPLAPRLRRLDLRHNELGSSLPAFREHALPNLEKLNLERCSIGPAVLRAIVDHPRSPRELLLADNHFGDEGWRVLATARHLQGLRLHKTRPRLAGVRALVESEASATLRWLDVSYNRLGVGAARAIANARHWGELRFLDVGGDMLTDAGTIAIMESTALPSLVGVILHSKHVSDAVRQRALAWADERRAHGLAAS
jgi:uncharacterized protein (TIGR02996 family)